MTEKKLERLRALIQAMGLDAALLQSVASFAWATDGAASYVNTATSTGEAALLITLDAAYLLTNNIEAPRLQAEERLHEQGWQFKVTPWYRQADLIGLLSRGKKLGADTPYPGAADLRAPLARLRADLTPTEGERFRQLGRDCAAAMNEAARALAPGMSELEIAALLAAASHKRGVLPIVNLVATDERVVAFRHPLPSAKKLERYAMLVLCGRRYGLVCSLTRFVHFCPLPDDLQHKANAVAAVDAAFIHATRPGRRVRDVFQAGVAAYAAHGFPDEWQRHHQGGAAGYKPREYVATPETLDPVGAGQAFAWNPSIAGTKSEDTILVGETSNEILTAIDGWPTVPVAIDGISFTRPAILELN